MWRLSAIFCLFLSLEHESVAYRVDNWKPPLSLGIVKLLGVNHFLYVNERRKTHIYTMNQGERLTCIVDPTGSKLVAVMEFGHACSFVIPHANGYDKVEVLLIDNVAEHIMKVSPNHDPLQDFRKSGQHWEHSIRIAEIPRSRRRSSPAPVLVPPRQPIQQPLITIHGVYHFVHVNTMDNAHLYEINHHEKLRCVTDLSGSKLVAIVQSGRLCPFAIPNPHGYEKVELLIIDNEAEYPVAVSHDFDPLQYFSRSKKNWEQFVRFAKLPVSSRPPKPIIPVTHEPTRPVTPPQRSQPPAVIELRGVTHYEILDQDKQPHRYKIGTGVQLNVIADPTGRKLVGIIQFNNVCSFVIQRGNVYQKVEVLIINDVAERIIEVRDDHDPLEDIKKARADWRKCIRLAEISGPSRPGSPRTVPAPVLMSNHPLNIRPTGIMVAKR